MDQTAANTGTAPRTTPPTAPSSGGSLAWKRLAPLDAVPADGARSFGAVTVFRVGEALHATGSRCPHMGYPMDKGTIRDGVVTCAWHQWEFDLGSGGCYRGACHDLPVHPIRIVDGQVEVALAPAAGDGDAAARLREGMLDGDTYQQARAIASLLETGSSPRAVAAEAAAQAFAHSVQNHRSLQAIVELRAITDAVRLAERFAGRDRIGVLLQGVRAAGGSAGVRPAVPPLPGRLTPERRSALLARYVLDASPLAIERLLLASPADGAAAVALLDLATAPHFLAHPEVAMAVVAVLDAADDLGAAVAGNRAPLLAWALGGDRQEPTAEERAAIAWLQGHEAELAALAASPRIAADTSGAPLDDGVIAAVLRAGSPEAAFAALSAALAGGVGFTAALDGFSRCFARRLDRLRPNNGGLWDTAISGVQRCHALRSAAARGPGRFRVAGLFALAWHAFESRWLQPGSPWRHEPAADASWDGYAAAFAANDLSAARRHAIGCLERGRDDAALRAFLAPLVREDLGPAALRTLAAALGEQARLDEWQPVLAGVLGYIMDGRVRQGVHAAARFGRSMLDSDDAGT